MPATAAQLEVLVTADTKDAESGLQRVGSSFSSVANIAQYAIGGIVANAFTAMGQAAAGGLSSAITSAGDFEAGLNRLQAVAGSSLQAAGFSLDDVKQKALDLGMATQYSAAEAEDAMINLAKGGVPIAGVMSDATDATLALAAAGEVALAPAADIVAKQLGVWSDTGVTAANVADLLAQAANASTVDVDSLALGLAQSGGAAKNAGVEYRDLVQTVGLISPLFSSASDAGTSFKTFVQRMIPTTDDATQAMIQLGLATEDGKSKFYDANGSFIGMRDAAQLLHDAVAPLTEEQRNLALTTIFGSDAIRTATGLAEAGAAGYDAFGASMNAQGTAADQATQRNQGFNFAMDQLKGSLETFGITIGTAVLPYLTSFINSLTDGVNAALAFVQGIINAPDPLAAFFSALDGILPGLGQLASQAYTWGSEIVGQLAAGMSEAVNAIVSVLNYIGSVISYWLQPNSPPKIVPNLDKYGTDAMNVYLQGWTQGDFSVFQEIGDQVNTALKGLVDTGQMGELDRIPALLGFREQLGGIINQLNETGSVSDATWQQLADGLGPIGGEVRNLVESYFDLETATKAVADAQDNVNSITEHYDSVLSDLKQQLDDTKKAFDEQTKPIDKQIDALDKQKQALQDQQKMLRINKTLNDPKASAEEKKRAQLEKQSLELEKQQRTLKDQKKDILAQRDAAVDSINQQIDATQKQKKQEVDAAKAALDQAKEQEKSAKALYATEKARMGAMNQTNSLLAEQARLVDAAAKKAEQAAKGAGGGGAGGLKLPKGGAGGGGFKLPAGGGPKLPALPDKIPMPDVTPITDGIGKINQRFTELNTAYNTQVAPVIQGIKDGFNTAGLILQKITPYIAGTVAGFAAFSVLRPVLDFLVPIITSLGTAFGFLRNTMLTVSAAVNEGFSVWSGLRVALGGPILEAIGGVVAALGGPLTIAIAGVALAIGLFAFAWVKNIGNVRQAVSDAWLRIQPLFEGMKANLAQAAKSLAPLGPSLSETFTKLAPILTVVAGILGAVLVGAINGIVATLPGLATMFVGAAQVILGVVNLVADVITGLVAIVKAVIAGDWQGAWNAAKRYTLDFASNLVTIFAGLVKTVIGMMGGLVSGIAGTLEGIGKTVGIDFSGVSSGINTFISKTSSDVDAFASNWKTKWSDVQTTASTQAETTKNNVNTSLSGMQANGIGSLWGLFNGGTQATSALNASSSEHLRDLAASSNTSLTGMENTGSGALAGLFQSGTQSTAALNSSSSEHLRDLATTSNTSLTSMFGDATSLMPSMQGVVTDQMGLMQSNTATSSDQMLTALGSAFTEMNRSAGMNVQALKFITTKTLDEVVGYMQAVVDRIRAIAPDMEAAGTYIGQQLDAGIAAGIERYIGAIISAARNAVRKAKEAAQAEAGIQSPSTVFRDEVGLQIAAGMALGIEAGTNLVTAATEKLADAALQSTLDAVNAQQDALGQLASLVGSGGVVGSAVLADFAAIQQQAQQYANISSKLATDYYQLRTKQVLDIAKLEADANKLAQQSNEETDGAKKQAILDQRALILQQLDLLKQAQAVELAQWQTHVAAIQDTMLQAVKDSAAKVYSELEAMASRTAKGVADYANEQSAALGKLLDLTPDTSKAADAQQKLNDLTAEQARLQQIIATADDPQLVADSQKQLVDITNQLTQAQEDYNKAVTDQTYQQAIYDHTQQLMEQAKAQADMWKSVNPQLAADYYNEQIDYISKLADLQEKYGQAQSDTQKAIIQEQINLLKTAHDAQMTQFSASVTEYQKTADQLAADQAALQQQSDQYLDIFGSTGTQTDAATTVAQAQQDVYNITVNAQGSNFTADQIKQMIQQALDEAARQAANRKR